MKRTQRSKLQSKSTQSRSQKKYFPLIAAVLLLVSLFLIKHINKNTQTSPNSVKVYFEKSKSNSSDGNLRIMTNSGSRKIAFVRVTFVFDPTVVKLGRDITTNPEFSTIIEKTSMDTANNDGRAAVVIASNPTDSRPSGIFEVATIKLESVSGVNLDDSSLKFSIEEMQFVDGDAKDLEIDLNEHESTVYNGIK